MKLRFRFTRLIASAVAASFSCASVAAAATVSWVPNADGFWHVASNWSSDPALPGPSDDVVIDVGGATVRTITHSQGDTSILSLLSQENFTLSGGTLSAGTAQVNGSFTISGGTLVNTIVGGSVISVSSSGQMRNATVNSGISLPFSGAELIIRDGITINGAATLGFNTRMRFFNAQTLLGTGTISIDGFGSNIVLSADPGNDATLTIANGLTVRGAGGSVGTHEFASIQSTLVNQGLISADVALGSLTVNPRAALNQGMMEAKTAGTLVIAPVGSFINSGTISARTAGTVSLGTGGGTWTSAGGTIVVDNATLRLGGSFSTSDLNQSSFQRSGGTVLLVGTLSNAAATLNIGTVKLEGGRIQGGTTAGLIELTFPEGVVDGVTVNGGMTVPPGFSGTARIRNGLTLNSLASFVNSGSTLRFEGTQTLGGTGTILFDASGSHTLSVDSDSVLTVFPTIVIRGSGATIGPSTFGNSAIANQGLISADNSNGSLLVNPTSLTNSGALEARSGGTLRLAEPGTGLINTGTIAARTSGTVFLGSGGSWTSAAGTIVLNNATLQLGSTFSTADLNQSAMQRTGGTIVLTGTLNNSSANLNIGTVIVNGGTINGGSAASTLEVTSSGARLNAVTVTGGLNLLTGNSNVRITNGLTLNSLASLAGGSTFLWFDGNQTLSGSGTVQFSSGSGSLSIDGESSLTIGNGITVRGFGATVGGVTGGTFGDTTLNNQGLISADSASGAITVNPTLLNNSGTLEARAGGTLRLAQPGTSLVNTGTITARTSGTVVLGNGGSWSSASGTIVLNNATLQLGSTFATADLNQSAFQRIGGTVSLMGTLNNDSSNLNIGTVIIAGGRINNGAALGRLASSAAGGHISGITIDGGLDMPSGNLRVTNGLTLNSLANLFGGSTSLRFDGTQTLSGNGTIQFSSGSGSLSVDGESTLTIGSGVTIRGFGALVGTLTPGSFGDAVLLNQGKILADNPSGFVTVSPTLLTNVGMLEALGGGTLAVGASTFTTSGSVVATTPSRVIVNPTLQATGGSIGGTGVVRANAGATIAGTVQKSGNGVFRVASFLDITPSSTLDMAGGSVILDYSGATPFAAIRNHIISGYNNGSWNGNGISSSSASMNLAYGVGYAEATALFISFPAFFAGESIDNTTVLVRYTRLGDSDLSGDVNLADFNRLAANFGQSNKLWTDGDSNYDQIVNLADFNLLAANFGLSASANGPTAQDWAALATLVPEPASAGVLIFASPLLLRRRSRISHHV